MSLALGIARPDLLLEQLSSAELAEWMAYAEIEPFGSAAEDFRAGQICATVANFAGKNLKEDTPAMTAQDFIKLGKPEELAEPVEEAEIDLEAHSKLLMSVIGGNI